MFGKRKKIRLLFKSGQTIEVTVAKLVVTRKESEMLRMEWTDMRPRPLFLDIDQIVAVFEL